jgi:NAD(P)-dependent dehydrogenase (short-subunit alcohol dehydrogenase family)
MSSLDHQPLIALVTGATTGLGKTIALRLARDDLRVVVVGRDAARGAAVVAQIEADGGQPTAAARPSDAHRSTSAALTHSSWGFTAFRATYRSS